MPGRRDGIAAQHPRLAGVARGLRKFLPPLNFITIHYAYFLSVILASSLIFWGSSDPGFRISYTDSLFLVVSAMTESGLNTVNLSQMTTWQQIILFLLIIFGSSIWVSIWTVAFRKHVLEQRFDAIASSGDASPRHAVSSFLRPRLSRNEQSHILPLSVSFSESKTAVNTSTAERLQPQARDASVASPFPTPSGRITFADDPLAITSSSARAQADEIQARRTQSAEDRFAAEDEKKSVTPGISAFLSRHTVGRNPQFYGLTRDEREELGGCEYRALKLLFVIVPLYFFLWQLLGCIALGAWINNHMASVATANGINPWWLGIFNGASAFNNSGMSLLDANMIPFENAHFVIITMGLMILAGNTAYPVFLRLILWTMLKVLRWTTDDDRFSETKETIGFILQYPRRVYTNLFPARPTWWLLFMIVLLNCIDWVAFELLNLGNPVVSEIPMGSRILDGLFQAIAVRSGGFYIVPIAEVYIGLQVLYVIMMYISVYPVVITMRHSNVYEERSLGIYYDDPDVMANHGGASAEGTNTPMTLAYELGAAIRRAFVPWHGVGVAPPPVKGDSPESRISFISQQIHGQLAHDLWWLALAVLVITTIETSHFLADPVAYSVFNVIFEVVSAYVSTTEYSIHPLLFNY
ncbi:hypothetical protein Sste5346_006799 [Sporothrix stenoceras]|uniref:Potassium transport protein n=1 Tax=Sporothrix stenoceras TaxID=5173 RepID=A0ABR3YX43_9PEZI